MADKQDQPSIHLSLRNKLTKGTPCSSSHGDGRVGAPSATVHRVVETFERMNGIPIFDLLGVDLKALKQGSMRNRRRRNR
eukprot:1141775-Pelagomonas_calceolata.AAC.1